MDTKIGIDGNPIKSPVAFCHYRKHRGYLTPKLMKTHGCLQRQCSRLEKLDSEFWDERRRKKNMAKIAKQMLEEKKL